MHYALQIIHYPSRGPFHGGQGEGLHTSCSSSSPSSSCSSSVLAASLNLAIIENQSVLYPSITSCTHQHSRVDKALVWCQEGHEFDSSRWTAHLQLDHMLVGLLARSHTHTFNVSQMSSQCDSIHPRRGLLRERQPYPAIQVFFFDLKVTELTVLQRCLNNSYTNSGTATRQNILKTRLNQCHTLGSISKKY